MKEKTNNYFTISSISKWTSIDKTIALPKLQRGFVWKPAQMGNLWDSILRGYPIGCFLTATNHDNDIKELFDGQQRATTILTGFYNPFSGRQNGGFFSIKKFPSIWIDLKPDNNKPSENEYSIQILTQSHPWGFKAADPSKVLSVGDRRTALDYIRTKSDCSNYLDIDSKNYVPWDSFCPVPLSFILELLDSQNTAHFEERLLEKLDQITLKTKHAPAGVDHRTLLKDYNFEKLHTAVGYAKNLMIPELEIDIDVVEGAKDESRNPTLFERLNAGGTQISGEELVYSIFKAKYPLCKDLVENISASYIAPSKLINLFARLSDVIANGNGNISYRKKIDIEGFRNLLKGEKYRSSLLDLIESSNGAQQKFNLILELFTDSISVPIILIKNILSYNLDLFFVLLSYFHLKNINNLEDLRVEDRRMVLKAIFHFSWFSVDKQKATKQLFNLLTNIEHPTGKVSDDFSMALKTLTKENLLFPLISPRVLQCVFDIIAEHKLNFWEESFIDEVRKINGLEVYFDIESDADRLSLRSFIDRVRYSKELLLLAQRNYIMTEFKEYNQFYTLEDTNRPWDWDHIFPTSWVYNRRAIHRLVKQWHGAIGNLRALSMADNRSENDHISPKDRLALIKVREASFVDSDDYEKFWSWFGHSDLRIINDSDEMLLIYLKANLNRTQRIYKEFYNSIVNIKTPLRFEEII